MFWLLSTVAGWLLRASSVGFLQRVGAFISQANDNQAQIAMKQIDAEIEMRKAAREIRVMTSGFWEMRLITFCIAGTFTTHLVAVGLDTVFGFAWSVPAFPHPFDEWEGVILLSFFGVQGVATVTGGLVAAIAQRFSK